MPCPHLFAKKMRRAEDPGGAPKLQTTKLTVDYDDIVGQSFK